MKIFLTTFPFFYSWILKHNYGDTQQHKRKNIYFSFHRCLFFILEGILNYGKSPIQCYRISSSLTTWKGTGVMRNETNLLRASYLAETKTKAWINGNRMREFNCWKNMAHVTRKTKLRRYTHTKEERDISLFTGVSFILEGALNYGKSPIQCY